MDQLPYFIKLAGQNRGPFSVAQLRVLYASRSISLDSERWTAKSDKQVKVKDIIFPRSLADLKSKG